MGIPSEALDRTASTDRSAARPQSHVVVLIHGIRDYAHWQSTVQKALQNARLKVELTNYERLDLARFLLPTGFFRRKTIKKFWDQIEHARRRHPSDAFSVITGSFGTYVVVEILRG